MTHWRCEELMKKIGIIDTTLREGNQTPDVRWNLESSTKIGLLLKAAGVGMIEAGHPIVSDAEAKRVRQVAEVVSPLPVLAHARALVEDVDSVASCGASWVGIFAGINKMTQATRMRKSREEILERIRSSVSHARSLGLKVRYTVEDASRSSLESMVLAFQTAVDAGADRICFSDTVGILTPGQTRAIVSFIKRKFPAVALEVHFHNDRGLAMANALSAVDGGVDWISTSVNGIGERCGITETCALIANLAYSGKIPFPRPGTLTRLSETVADLSGVPTSPLAPIVGQNAFRHTAKLHVTAVKRSALSYQWIEPELFGRGSEIEGIESEGMEIPLAISRK